MTDRPGQSFAPALTSTVEISFPHEQRMRLVGHWMLRMCPHAWHCRYVPGAYETFAFEDFIAGSSLARRRLQRARNVDV